MFDVKSCIYLRVYTSRKYGVICVHLRLKDFPNNFVKVVTLVYLA